jgi:hypothetical protein
MSADTAGMSAQCHLVFVKSIFCMDCGAGNPARKPAFRPAGPAGKRVRRLKSLPHKWVRGNEITISGLYLGPWGAGGGAAAAVAGGRGAAE